MSDLGGDTTGMQNPIFKIMGSQATGQNQQGMGQNPMNLNPNSMNPQMGMNPQQQMQMNQGMGNPMGTQMGMNQGMNQGMNPMQGMDMNNQQQMGNQMGNAMGNPMGNTGMNQMGNGMGNPMGNTGMNQMPGMDPMQMSGNNNNNPMMGQQSQMGNPMQQQMGMNPQMMAMGAGGMDMQAQMMQQQMMQQQMMQQQMMQQQMMQQQMMQQQMMQQQAKQAQMQNILNQAAGTGQGAANPSIQMPSSVPSTSQGAGISVIFRASGATGQASAPIMVQCMSDEKVSEVIEKYRNKSGDRDPTKKFIFNAKNLAPSLTVAEAGITNNANIFVVATKGIKGAF